MPTPELPPCEECANLPEGERHYNAFAHLVSEPEGSGLLCMLHLRALIEMMRFIAAEGPQRKEDIDAQLARLEESYPWPEKVIE